jgi:hypothetical protein
MKMTEFIPVRPGESGTSQKTINHKIVVRLEDQVTIPFDEGNRDYQEYLAWLELGNEPLDFNVDLLETQEDLDTVSPRTEEVS